MYFTQAGCGGACATCNLLDDHYHQLPRYTIGLVHSLPLLFGPSPTTIYPTTSATDTDMTSVDDLPPEILIEIWLLLHTLRNLLSCQQVCRRWRAIAESTVIRYRCELAFSAAVDRVTQGVGFSERLDALRRYQHTRRSSTLCLNPALSAIGEENDGNASHIPSRPVRHLDFLGPLIALHVGNEVRLHRLATTTRCVEAMTWSVDVKSLDLTLQVGACDLSQNIVALCGNRMSEHGYLYCYLFSLRENGSMVPHASAAKTVLGIIEPDWDAVRAEIRGDWLAVAVSSYTHIAFFFDWKSGALLFYIKDMGSPGMFHILDNDLVLVVLKNESDIRACAIESFGVQLLVVTPRYLLKLPQHWIGHGRLESTMLHLLPQAVWPSTMDSGLFCADPDAALTVFHFTTALDLRPSDYAHESVCEYIFCIPRSVLLEDLCRRATASLSLSVSNCEYPIQWEQWTSIGLLLPFCNQGATRQLLARSAWGSRVAFAFNNEWLESPSMFYTDILVFDVHRYAHVNPADAQAMEVARQYFNLPGSHRQEGHDQMVPPPKTQLPYHVSHYSVTHDKRPSLRSRQGLLLLEDSVIFRCETWDELNSGMPTTTHCFMFTA
ncbi:hypothetical protein C8Q77DRAFT_833021 [Trametes polyzona]|nr:hypothetical protein C8Q77DRAFT_833021 [Trametes polyzona]